MSEVKTVEELQTKLSGFCGTIDYHQHTFKGLMWTDGIQEMIDEAEANWLMDIVQSYTHKLAKIYRETTNTFWICRIEAREDNTGIVDFREDTDKKPVIEQEIPYTNFPKGVFEFYVIVDHGLDSFVSLLKSEY